MKKFALILSAMCLPIIPACSQQQNSSTDPTTPMTQAQFLEVEKNCNLKNASLVSSSRTETSTVNGIPMTVTYEDDVSGSVTIQHSNKLDGQEGAALIICLNKEFQRLNAIADVEFGR